MSLKRTLEQRRAAFAFDSIDKLGKDAGEYRDIARSVAGMILINGFGQTMAFLRSKGNAHIRLYRHFQDWLSSDVPGAVYRSADGQKIDLMRCIANGSSGDLRRATEEALALSVWLKRFADAVESQAKTIINQSNSNKSDTNSGAPSGGVKAQGTS